MKKWIALVFLLVCVFGLAGCGQQEYQIVASQTKGENEGETKSQTERESECETDSRSDSKSEQNPKPEIEEPYISIRDFSYAEDCEIYVDGEPGVKASGFVNTADVDIDLNNVVELAKNECTVKWDTVNVYLDTAACIWKVVFFIGAVERDGYIECVAGGDQSVYLDYSGKTVLIVYGE